MVKRSIIYLIIIGLLSALLFLSLGCLSEGRDSGSGIRGRLMSIGNSLPVANAKLSLDSTNIFGSTDSTGYFRLDGIPSGSYTAYFIKYDALVSEINFVVTDEQSANGDVIQLIWPDPEGDSGTLTGVVQDEEGKPIVGAEVLLGRPDENVQLVYTDDLGAYYYENLEVVGGYSLIVSVDGYLPASVSLALGPTGSDRVNFELEPIEPPASPHGNVTGRILDVDVIPLHDAYVIIYPLNSLKPVYETTSEMATGLSGEFMFNGVVDGPYMLWAGRAGYGVRAQEIYVTAGLTWDGEIVLDGSYSVEF